MVTFKPITPPAERIYSLELKESEAQAIKDILGQFTQGGTARDLTANIYWEMQKTLTDTRYIVRESNTGNSINPLKLDLSTTKDFDF